MRGVVTTLLAAGLSLGAATAHGAPRLANRCFDVSGLGVRHVKPTGLGTYLLYDGTETGPAIEWRIERAGRGYRLQRVADGTTRTARLTPVVGCKRYPEAGLGVRGRPRQVGLWGIADAHVHLTASLRAGGRVISGEPFSPYGLPDALGRDAEVHGPDGAADVTGNLLRSGSPAGTHDTAGWPSFSGWPTFDTNTHQQIYYRWLQRAWRGGLRLAVAQTVEDQPLCQLEPLRSHSCDETETIELQARTLRDLQAYADAQAGGRGFFRIVTTPRQAARMIRAGRLAVIIGVESSNPFGCSEVQGMPACDRADVDAGIDRLRRAGVRGLFVAHWVDNALAGAALEGGDKGTFIGAMQVEQTGGPFATGDCPQPGQGDSCNTRGLTELGEYAIRRLMDRHMLIEADHLSERARQRVLAIARERRYPLVSSHTGTGGTWTDPELRVLRETGGLATARLDAPEQLAKTTLRLRARGVGPALGTDVGGFSTLPAPVAGLRYPFQLGGARFTRQRTGERAYDLAKDGMAHYGLLPDLLARARTAPGGRRALRALYGSAAAYLRMWRRVVRQ
jgi:microsomal dipeptidase-like Zn-dependent dipeptidase